MFMPKINPTSVQRLSSVFGLAVLFFTLVSCEGNTRLEWSLENQSSSELTIIHKSWDYAGLPAETLLISSGETLLLGANDVLGGQPNPWAPASFIDTLFIYNSTGALSTKDWEETDTWAIETEELKKMPASWRHRYTLTVGDGDF